MASLENITDHLPGIASGHPAKNMLASDIAPVTSTDLLVGAYQLQIRDSLSPVVFLNAPDDQLGASGMNILQNSTDLGLPFRGTNISWKLAITSQNEYLVLEKIYLVVRYTLK